MGLTYVRTLYHRMGVEHEAVLVPWSKVEEILGHPHTGAAEEDRLIVQALRAAGAPAWVSEETEGWVDEEGWGLIGPAEDSEAAAVAQALEAQAIEALLKLQKEFGMDPTDVVKGVVAARKAHPEGKPTMPEVEAAIDAERRRREAVVG